MIKEEIEKNKEIGIVVKDFRLQIQIKISGLFNNYPLPINKKLDSVKDMINELDKILIVIVNRQTNMQNIFLNSFIFNIKDLFINYHLLVITFLLSSFKIVRLIIIFKSYKRVRIIKAIGIYANNINILLKYINISLCGKI